MSGSGSGSPSATRPGTTTKCRLQTRSATLRVPMETTTRSTTIRRTQPRPLGSFDRPAAVPVRVRCRPTRSSTPTWREAILKEGDPLAGIGQYMCGERWIFPKPIRAGDVLWHSETLHSADLRASEFGGGVGAIVSRRHSWEDQSGSSLRDAVPRLLACGSGQVQEGRQEPADRASQATTEGISPGMTPSTRRKSIRGASPRTPSDVAVGDQLGPIAKGPLSVTDMVAWHVGVGWGMYGGGTSTHRLPNSASRPEVLSSQRTRVLRLCPALPLGRRVGAAHGTPSRL